MNNNVRVRGTVTYQLALRYLRVIIDVKLNFKTNIENVCEKASRLNTALSRFVSNINQTKRLLLAQVTQSIMMYAAPVWRTALDFRTYAKTLIRLSALSAFRTASYKAIGVISGKRVHDRVKIIGSIFNN